MWEYDSPTIYKSILSYYMFGGLKNFWLWLTSKQYRANAILIATVCCYYKEPWYIAEQMVLRDLKKCFDDMDHVDNVFRIKEGTQNDRLETRK